MINHIKKIFISGLIAILPLAITAYILVSFVSIVESILGELIKSAIPEGYYLPGYGFLATLVVIFTFGLLVNNLITAAVVKKIQNLLTEIPIIKAVYSPLRDLVHLFSSTSKNQGPQKVVLVKVSPEMSLLGLVTRESFEDLQFNKSSTEDRVAVLILMSYALGGYTVLVNRKNIETVDMPVETAMRLAVTGWIRKTDEY